MKRIVPISIVVSVLLALPLGWYCGTAGAIWGAVLIVVTAGGSIAYLGDVIGYSLGKKRVTLFGLRPRDSAKLIGIIAGAVSAIAAGVVLLLIDGAFRVALFTGHELAHNLLQLRHENTRLERRIEISNATLRNAENDKNQAVRAKSLAEADEHKAVVDRNTARAEFAGATKALALVHIQLAKTQADLAVRQTDLDRATQAIKGLQAKSLDLQMRNRIALQQYNEIENKITNEAIPTIKAARSSDVVYRNGQEVGRGIVRNGTKAEVVGSLNQLLDTLSGKAEAAGAGRGGYKRAVKLAWIQLRTKKASSGHNDEPSFVSEGELLDALADQIRASNSDSVVVIATSLGNSFENLPAILQLHPYRNHLVLHAGTVLGETTLHNEGGLGPEEIVGRVQRLLVAKVRPAAIAAGVIPVIESTRAEPELGNLPLADLLKVVTEVQAIKGDSTITAITSTDIWSGDQLHLRFTVKPGAASNGEGR
ncbi:MAG: DUF3084 domain-containing protein [Capsulimonadaceae bacterium]|nr:DUF3084 domain-containing protein [Capsulimonadaceae bacterium]